MTLAELIVKLKEIENIDTTNMPVKVIRVAKLMDIEDIFIDNNKTIIIQVDKK